MRQVCAVRGGQMALENINAVITEGEIVSIIGPNGSGKTTLIKCILGLLPYTGRILLFEKESKKAFADIGYVPQRFSFDRHFPLTVAELLKLASQDKKDIAASLREVDMHKCIHHKLGELSGGQLQRVLIARAIVNRPKLLILDEPTSGIDREGESNFYEIIKAQNQTYGTTVVMVSHEINMVYAYATQVICLNKSLICAGSPREVITKDSMARLYGENVAAQKHSHHHYA